MLIPVHAAMAIFKPNILFTDTFKNLDLRNLTSTRGLKNKS